MWLGYFSTNAHKVLPGVDDVGVQSDALSVLLPDISCRIVILPMRGGTPTAVDRFTIEIQTVQQLRDTEIDEEKKGIAIVTCNCDSMLPLQNEVVSILRGVIFLLMISFCETQLH